MTQLLTCEFCKAPSETVAYCFACGRPRNGTVFVNGKEHTGPIIVRVCISGKVTLYVNAAGFYIPYDPNKALRRPVVQQYVDGFVREVYSDTGELVVPLPKAALKKVKQKRTPKPVQETPVGYRDHALKRDKCCLRCGTDKRLTVHHIVHRSLGGTNNPVNLQTLCSDCHEFVHNELRLPSGTPFKHVSAEEELQRERDAFDAYLRKRHDKAKRKRAKGRSFEQRVNLAEPFLLRLRAERSLRDRNGGEIPLW